MTFDRPSRTETGRIRLLMDEAVTDLPDRITSPKMREVLCHIWRLKVPDDQLEADHPTKIKEPELGAPAIMLPQIKRA
jgi:hypothetical protein